MTAGSVPLGKDDELRIGAFASSLEGLRSELHRRIIGQDEVITQVLAAILAEGHCLIVGLPGLAKTLLVSSISELLSLDFKRIQFTPDLMPSDITGATTISSDLSGQRGWRFLQGPIFANVILADEINRTPPKTQSALIEAMEERQVSTGGKVLRLERPFFVLATENPLELEGTYPLPVTQLDRFLFNITIDYPTADDEFRMICQTTSTYEAKLGQVLSRDEVIELLNLTRKIEVPAPLLDYASRVVRSTRPASPNATPYIREVVAWGAGPRATQALVAGARAMALMAGRRLVVPADIHAVAIPTLRHRVLLRYHAEAEGLRSDEVIWRALESMPDRLYQPAARQDHAPAAASKPGFFERLFSRR